MVRSKIGKSLEVFVRLGAASALLTACTAYSDAPESESSPRLTSQKRQAVLGGTLSERESVVLVRSTGPEYPASCTGTLVAPNLVLTARHCISNFTGGDFTCTVDGYLDLSRPRSPATAGDMGLPYAPEQIAIHQGQVPDSETPTALARAVFAPETDTICRNDIAFLVLEDELALPFESIRLDDGLEQNEQIEVAGFGQNDDKRTQRMERSGLQILAIGPSDFYPVQGNAPPRTFAIGKSVCPGDSGGPALSTETEEILGVFSFFRGACESSEVRNFFTHVASFKSVAVQAFEAAGYSNLIEPEEPPKEEPPVPAEGGAPPDEPEEKKSGESTKNKWGCSLGSTGGHGTRYFMMWGLLVLALRRIRNRQTAVS